MLSHLSANVERFTGFADTYDKYRPQPPIVLIDILTQLAQVERPRLVVDIGCGTGLATRIWAGRADTVIGIEPSEDMRRMAEEQTAARSNAKHIRYKAGYSHDTGLADACADVVTISQALHWMEPAPTFGEVARILRDGGVFAAIDCDWPPTINREVEQADVEFMTRTQKIGEACGYYEGVVRWSKHEHLARIKASGKFQYVKEIVVHHVEEGDAERLIGLAKSQGSVAELLKRGMTEAEIGLDEYGKAARRALADRTVAWYFSYRIRIGVK